MSRVCGCRRPLGCARQGSDAAVLTLDTSHYGEGGGVSVGGGGGGSADDDDDDCYY